MVNQDVSVPLNDNSNNSDRSRTKNVREKRRGSFSLSGRKQRTVSGGEVAVKKSRSTSSKVWMKSQKGRKFTFSSPEDYMEYAARRQSSGELKPQPQKKEEKKPEETKTEPRTRGWKRYRKSRKFTFTSPEEYMEYAARRTSSGELKTSIKKFENASKKRPTLSTEFDVLDATADVTLDVPIGDQEDGISAADVLKRGNSDVDDDDDDEEEELPDIESNNNTTDTDGTPDAKKKGCTLRRKMTCSDVWRLALLWIVILGLALLLAKHPGMQKDDTEAPTMTPMEVLTSEDDTSLACSLCPSGSSVHQPEREVIMEGISCQAGESSCFFQCFDILAPRVYTCGEVEKLASESSSQCNDGDSDSCSEFQQAASQCCSSDMGGLGVLATEYASQTEHAVNHLLTNGN